MKKKNMMLRLFHTAGKRNINENLRHAFKFIAKGKFCSANEGVKFNDTRETRSGSRKYPKKNKDGGITIDRSALYNPDGGVNYDDDDDIDLSKIPSGKEPMTPLAKDLYSYIQMRGAMTLHDYMAQCLNHILHGYYQSAELEKIGADGDFITSPEISQLFGEMIAIFFLSTWHSLGSPPRVNIIELGPGKGTLMHDILRVARRFPNFNSALNVHMVELSPSMREIQQRTLKVTDATYIERNSSSIDNSRADPSADTNKTKPIISASIQPKSTQSNSTMNRAIASGKTENDIPIFWHSFLDQVPDTEPILLIGQEFLDAFPVHQFSYTAKGWREKLIDIDTSADSPHHFRIVLSPSETPACKVLLGQGKGDTLSKSDDNMYKSDNTTQGLSEGDGIEICPLALAISEDVAARVCKSGGLALFVDYGESLTQGDSLRAFKKHKQVSMLAQPGEVDLTADVNFSACARAAKSKGAKVFGAITQGSFLLSMGIIQRVEQLVNMPSTSEKQAEDLVAAMKILVDASEADDMSTQNTDGESSISDISNKTVENSIPKGMGRRFKVLAVCSPDINELPGFRAD